MESCASNLCDTEGLDTRNTGHGPTNFNYGFAPNTD
jgi:hypothetical protein